MGKIRRQLLGFVEGLEQRSAQITVLAAEMFGGGLMRDFEFLKGAAATYHAVASQLREEFELEEKDA